MRVYRLLTAKRETIQQIKDRKKISITYSIKAKTPRFIKIGSKVLIGCLEDPVENVLVTINEKHRIKNKVLQDGLSDHLVLMFTTEEIK